MVIVMGVSRCELSKNGGDNNVVCGLDRLPSLPFNCSIILVVSRLDLV